MGNQIVIKFEKVGKKFKIGQKLLLKEALLDIFKPASTEDFWALKNISFEVKKGETLGIIGPNGSGKSTILKLIAGVMTPTEGRMTINGKVSPLIELGAGFHPELTGRENVYLNGSILGLSRKEIDQKFKDIVDFAELWDFIDTPVKHYSSGMYMRLGFSVAIDVNPEILLVDEILAVGDVTFQEKCLDRMRDFHAKGVTIVFVSHSLETVKTFCQNAIFLDDGHVRGLGSADKVVATYTSLVLQAMEKEHPVLEKKGKDLITKVEFLKNDQPTYLFQTGDDLTIKIFYSTNKPIRKPVFGIGIHREGGVHIAGPNSKTGNFVLSKIQGKGSIEYEIKNLPLKDGKYYVTVALFSWDLNQNYEYQDKAYSFEVAGGIQDNPYGILKLNDIWRQT